ncbi:hypothetical protein BDQ17DRAFT_1259791, partial [Cyathus striatus]
VQQIAKEAYLKLGQEGIIGDALNHSCKECTHDYKATVDHINLVPEPKVKMVVVDGIFMGPNHCAYQNCSEKLANA